MFSKDDLLALRKPKVKKVDLVSTDSGESFAYIRVMTGGERASWEKLAIGKSSNLRAELLVRTLCDDEGKRLFNDKETEQVNQLPCDDLETLMLESMEFNHMTDKKKKEAEEELKKTEA